MMRTVRALLPLLLLPVLLTGCGTGDEGGTRGADAADPGLDAAAHSWGVAPELVRVTRVPGFTVVPQSVGAYGDDGFAAVYRSDTGDARFGLFGERGTLTAESCPRQPLVEGSDERVACERDGDAWYRKAGDHHEYAVPADGVVIRLSADADKVGRATLRQAAESAHRPDSAELAALLPAAQGADT
ncbi:hypothetical protein [Streptomyces asoensis]|uniref:hypothetical protein n=1 Tax=Streptomyces asoensis TaxID=249586 RepID=UPI0034003C97